MTSGRPYWRAAKATFHESGEIAREEFWKAWAFWRPVFILNIAALVVCLMILTGWMVLEIS